jgi:hypothetical protein
MRSRDVDRADEPLGFDHPAFDHVLDRSASEAEILRREPVNPLGEMRSWVKTDHPAMP